MRTLPAARDDGQVARLQHDAPRRLAHHAHLAQHRLGLPVLHPEPDAAVGGVCGEGGEEGEEGVGGGCGCGGGW